MITFTGTTSLRQCVKNKPNPEGLKSFVLATPDGLVLDFIVYQGLKTWPAGKPEPKLGIGGSVVKALATNVQPGHTVFMDRYFTNSRLLEYLGSERRIYAVGTILTGRVPASCKQKLTSNKKLMRSGGGT
ncbi:Transposase IS4 [Popillia japonica]|uniref:Transposase IS4 n=1 Tax=Popillia japonica TaxID=7064 RepID=A0AAW1KIA1_POPJA